MGFLVQYATDLSTWEKWQHEYRYGAFYIFPPDGVIETIDTLRRKYDPKSAAICQAHISLSEPLTHPITDEELAEIRNAVGKIESFELSYGPLKTFPPYPGVCFDVSPKDEFSAVREAIHACSAFAGSNLKRKGISPHITIAEFGMTWEESDELRKRLDSSVSGEKFSCDTIEYAVPNEEFYFERKLKLALGHK